MARTPVEEIKDRLDIVELISEYVQLKPAGKYHKALCPIHHEKTPSFMVDRASGVWHCFGCGKGGDVFSFIQELEGTDFPETLRLLAKKANVELPRYDPTTENRKTRLYAAARAAAEFYHRLLRQDQVGEKARAYLRERGVDDLTVDSFLIGYAPDAWDQTLINLRQRGFSDEEIFLAGLTVKKERGSGYYDRFRHRLMFPIADAHGAIVGFGGRALPPAPEDTAKYINTPQSLLYNKSEIIYALDRAKTEIKRQDRAVVVEGYMDVIASHQAGVTNVVATSGTAFTPEQLRTIKRYTNNLIIAFDTDLAGEAATRRGIDLALEREFDVRVVQLPAGKDPDELIRRDAEAWRIAVKKAERFLDYAFARTFARTDRTTVDGKKQAAAALLPLIAKLNHQIEQTHYLQKLAEAIRVSEQTLRSRLEKKSPTRVSNRAPATTTPKTSRGWKLSQQALALLLRSPDLLAETSELLKLEYLDPDFRPLYKLLLDQYNRNHAFTIEDFETYLKANAPGVANDISLLLLFSEQHFSEADPETIKAELAATVRFLITSELDRAITEVRNDLRDAEAAQDQARMTALLERFTELTGQRTNLTR